MKRLLTVAVLLCGALSPALGVAADRPGTLKIELNRLEPRENDACRVWLVLSNGSSEALESVRLDLVLFGRDGVIARRVAVDAGRLPAGRTQARIFDLAEQPCERLGMVLLNDLLSCGGTDAAQRNACMDQTTLASRVEAVAFQK